MKLWHPADPAIPTHENQVRPDRDAPGTHPASAPGEAQNASSASRVPYVVGTQGRTDALGSPDDNVIELPLNGGAVVIAKPDRPGRTQRRAALAAARASGCTCTPDIIACGETAPGVPRLIVRT